MSHVMYRGFQLTTFPQRSMAMRIGYQLVIEKLGLLNKLRALDPDIIGTPPLIVERTNNLRPF